MKELLKDILLSICAFEFQRDMYMAKLYKNWLCPSPNSITYLLYYLSDK